MKLPSRKLETRAAVWEDCALDLSRRGRSSEAQTLGLAAFASSGAGWGPGQRVCLVPTLGRVGDRAGEPRRACY